MKLPDLVMQAPHTPNSSALQPKTKNSLARAADAILKRAGFDAMTGIAKNDKRFQRNKRAKQKRAARSWRERIKKFGKFGAASPARRVEPDYAGEDASR